MLASRASKSQSDARDGHTHSFETAGGRQGRCPSCEPLRFGCDTLRSTERRPRSHRTPPETLASPSSVKVQTSAPRPSRAARANRVCAVVRATPPTLHLLVQASRKPGRCVSLLAGNLRMQAVFIAVKALRWKVKCIGRFPRKRNEHAALASNAPPRCSYDAPK